MIYPVDSAIHLSKNWGMDYKTKEARLILQSGTDIYIFTNISEGTVFRFTVLILVQFDTALTDRVSKGQRKYLSGLKRKRTLCL